MPALKPSHPLIEQRVRNRLIEWLEMLVHYETDPPPFDLNAVLNQWEDWNSPLHSYSAPTYSESEAKKLLLVANAWEGFCKGTPNTISNEREALGTSEWITLVLACQVALSELRRRGRLPEEIEVGHGENTV
ncbi:hypothetical protein [Acidovorax sp. 62]|uniref:hypothetical protein n=1 Tax=Acidovorax sp. 62 TaxID=2035203 RepID=UPI001178C975|nr:hypothetical protein [Acidovorax sp. 62]